MNKELSDFYNTLNSKVTSVVFKYEALKPDILICYPDRSPMPRMVGDIHYYKHEVVLNAFGEIDYIKLIPCCHTSERQRIKISENCSTPLICVSEGCSHKAVKQSVKQSFNKERNFITRFFIAIFSK